MNRIDVVFTIDENYLQHFTVALTSLLSTNSDCVRDVYLVYDEVRASSLDTVIDFFSSVHNKHVIALQINSDILSKYKITEHASTSVYFRLLLPEIIPQNVGEILFLDSDLVVDGNIAELTEMIYCEPDFPNYYVYAADHNYGSKELSRLRDMGLHCQRYFNSGVMLINLKKWREDSITNRALVIADVNNEKLVWWDQDVFNIAFDGQWGTLPSKYNCIDGKIKCNDKPAIIHYAGSSKPWHFLNNHPRKALYWKYLNLTPYKGFKPKDINLRNIIKKLEPSGIKNFRRRFSSWFINEAAKIN